MLSVKVKRQGFALFNCYRMSVQQGHPNSMQETRWKHHQGTQGRTRGGASFHTHWEVLEGSQVSDAIYRIIRAGAFRLIRYINPPTSPYTPQTGADKRGVVRVGSKDCKNARIYTIMASIERAIIIQSRPPPPPQTHTQGDTLSITVCTTIDELNGHYTICCRPPGNAGKGVSRLLVQVRV